MTMMPRRLREVFSKGVLFGLLLLAEFVISRASSLESSSYKSVTALDKYGNSVQLQHAREAASRHGRLCVVAAASSEDGPRIVLVSINQQKDGILQNESTKCMANRLLSMSPESEFSYMVCTGVKADASWLIHAIRDYAKRVWERYNVKAISQERYSQAISEALLEFMGFDRTQEHHDGVGRVVVTSDRDRGWARPLGVQVVLATPNTKTASLTVLEPSGIPFQTSAFAMGKQSSLVNDALQKRYDHDMSVERVQELLLAIVREAVQDNDESKELIVEVLSKQGVHVSCAPLRLGQDS